MRRLLDFAGFPMMLNQLTAQSLTYLTAVMVMCLMMNGFYVRILNVVHSGGDG